MWFTREGPLGRTTILMKRPPHPGRIIRQECIEPLGLTVTEAAVRLGVTRQNLNNLLNGKSGISPEMAIRLSKAFGSRAEVWLGRWIPVDATIPEVGTSARYLLVGHDEPGEESRAESIATLMGRKARFVVLAWTHAGKSRVEAPKEEPAKEAPPAPAGGQPPAPPVTEPAAPK